MKTCIKVILILLAVLLVVIGGYASYAFIAYDRLEDNMNLTVEQAAADAPAEEEEIKIISYNIGFGAYSDDYSFFMDGGKESRARSPEAVRQNVGGAIATVQAYDPDLVLFQEVDLNGTRSHHINETELVTKAFPEYSSVIAQNYDSPYLMWPLNAPHGANQSGTVTLSRYAIASSLRRSLPIESGFMKIVDLDRCYSVNRIPMESGKELVVYNFHLSAYTSDGKIAEEQLEMLFADMQQEVQKGNYTVAGGDFNKDLLGDSAAIFGVDYGDITWAQPIPAGLIPDGLRIEVPFEEENPIPSCRNADRPYGPDDYVLTVDGFILSDNIKTVACNVIDTGFKWSDHNPVFLKLVLSQS